MEELSMITEEDRQISNIHPGEILKKEFLEPFGMSESKLAGDLNMQPEIITQIIREHKSISADTAIRLSRYFGTTTEFWLHLQNAYDIEALCRRNADMYNSIKPYSTASGQLLSSSL